MKAQIEIVKSTVVEKFGKEFHLFNDKRANGRRLKFARLCLTKRQLNGLQKLLAAKGVNARVSSNVIENPQYRWNNWHTGLCVHIENK